MCCCVVELVDDCIGVEPGGVDFQCRLRDLSLRRYRVALPRVHGEGDCLRCGLCKGVIQCGDHTNLNEQV
jgi:hypothetical protein